MTVLVSSRHMDITPALKTFAEQKVSKLTRYYDRIQEIEVVLDSAKDHVNVEIIVNAEHKAMFIARTDGPDAYANIDGCIDKLERQLTDHKEKVRNRKHPDDVDGDGRPVAKI
ncbi:MAG TPA: ribosome-associated translation inhibitor RaiA [Tepidisphaeraceae bacterium]|nr:ribosome-associated translation inhibitor RaiA [Tepidisphaeraceae bacterium]